MSNPERGEREREGVGAPADRGGDDRTSSENAADVVGASPFGSESSVVNRRDLPGGSFRPARTPGSAMGPTTRETARAMSRDANDSEIQGKPEGPSD